MFPPAVSPCLATQLSRVLEALAGFPSFGGGGWGWVQILGTWFSSICRGTPARQRFPLLCHQCAQILCLLPIFLVLDPQNSLGGWNNPSSWTQWPWRAQDTGALLKEPPECLASLPLSSLQILPGRGHSSSISAAFTFLESSWFWLLKLEVQSLAIPSPCIYLSKPVLWWSASSFFPLGGGYY